MAEHGLPPEAGSAIANDPRPIRVYVVDDEPLMQGALRRVLGRFEFDVVFFQSARTALAALAGDPAVDVLLTDLAMPEMDGMELLREVKAERPEVEVVMMTAHANFDAAIAAVKAGAYHFLPKPFDAEAPRLLLRQAAERKRLLGRARALEHELRTREAVGAAPTIVGSGVAMRRVRQLIAAAAPTTASVLILGESGTGKELVAQAVHALSRRRQKAFLAINCSALADSLLESELFGYVRGAFTGADKTRTGLFEAADGGTIMLDEIGHAPASVQTKLLRVLQEGEVRPVGSTRSIAVDVRVIAATNVDLEAAVRVGRFREDLFYRLNVLPIHVPPLRERRDDIPALAYYLLARVSAKHGRDVREIAPDAMDALVRWHWPGNVRELENALERAVVLGRGGRVGVTDLPDVVAASKGWQAGDVSGPGLDYRAARTLALTVFERAFIEEKLAHAAGNISEAARLAGIDRANFRRIMKRLRDDS